MEDVRIICTPFLLAAIVFTLAMFYYEQHWKNKNPWWRQIDREMRLSQAERAYRQNERRKHNNALMSWFAVLFMIIGLMIFVLTAQEDDGFSSVNNSWLYFIPVIGIIILALSGIRRK